MSDEEDPFFFGSEKKDDIKEKEPIIPSEPIDEKVESKPKKPKKAKSNPLAGEYTSKQKTTAAILYIAIIFSVFVTIVGSIWSVFDIFATSGKLNAFLSLSIGYQMAILGGFAAGFFFLVVFFYGLSKKGVKVIMKITFKPREIEEKYKGKIIVKIFAGAMMFSIFAIIIGIIVSIILDVIFQSSGTFSISSVLGTFDSTGPFVLFLGMFLLIMVGLAFALNWLWYNGYYLILRLVTDLEKED